MPPKKLSIENPANSILQFLSTTQNNQAQEKSGTENCVTRKPTPIQNRPITDKNGKELKRKRFNLLFVPSVYDDIGKIAYVDNITINEAINRALVMYRDAKKDVLAKYTQIEKLKASDPVDKTAGA